jgi:hypothetical protein
MYTYEKFIVYPGPHYEKHSTAIQRSGVPMREPFYLVNNTNSKNLDNCRYVVKRMTKKGKSPLLKWRVDIDMKYIQLYWSTHLHHLENNNHVILIRPKYRIIFRCIARLIQLKKRAQVRVKTRQSFRVSGMFKRHIFAPASHRVFAYI